MDGFTITYGDGGAWIDPDNPDDLRLLYDLMTDPRTESMSFRDDGTGRTVQVRHRVDESGFHRIAKTWQSHHRSPLP